MAMPMAPIAAAAMIITNMAIMTMTMENTTTPSMRTTTMPGTVTVLIAGTTMATTTATNTIETSDQIQSAKGWILTPAASSRARMWRAIATAPGVSEWMQIVSTRVGNSLPEPVVTA